MTTTILCEYRKHHIYILHTFIHSDTVPNQINATIFCKIGHSHNKYFRKKKIVTIKSVNKLFLPLLWPLYAQAHA